MLPRLDVGYSALVGALAALTTLLLGALAQGTVVDWWTVLPPLLVVIVMGVVGYLVSASKELLASIAGAILVIVQFVISARRGEVVDTALVTTAVTYLSNMLLLWLLPRLQPFTRTVGGQTARGFHRRP